jgi:hypothetical protein
MLQTLLWYTPVPFYLLNFNADLQKGPSAMFVVVRLD